MREAITSFVFAVLVVASATTTDAQDVLDRLEQRITDPPREQRIEPGYLGAMMNEAEARPGIRVLEVIEQSPAAQSGLMPDDLITAINREPVANLDAAAELLSRHPAGSIISFDVIRVEQAEEQSFSLQVKLGQRPANGEGPMRNFGVAPLGDAANPPGWDVELVEARVGWLGLTVRDYSAVPPNPANAGIEAGTYVTAVAAGTPAEKADIRPNDLIYAIDRTAVRSLDEFLLTASAAVDWRWRIALIRDGETIQVEVRLPQLDDGFGRGPEAGRPPPDGPPNQGPPAGDARFNDVERRLQRLEALLREMQRQQAGGN